MPLLCDAWLCAVCCAARSALSPEDKLRIKLNLNIENDPASLQQIADRSSVDKTAVRLHTSGTLHIPACCQLKWCLEDQGRSMSNHLSVLVHPQSAQLHKCGTIQMLQHASDAVAACLLPSQA
jgi:hypothetical protein